MRVGEGQQRRLEGAQHRRGQHQVELQGGADAAAAVPALAEALTEDDSPEVRQFAAVALGLALLPDNALVFQGLLPAWADNLVAGFAWLQRKRV